MKKLLLFSLIAMVAVMAGYSQQKAIVWSEDFEGDWTVNWHVDAGTWEVGSPTSGPNKAYNGTKCAATVLNGNYSQPTNTRLIRHTTFIVPSASENPRFRFWYWFSYSTNDWGEVQIKTNTGEWEAISNQMNNQGGDAWSYGSIDISKYAGSTVQLAFLFHSADDGSSYSDDVSSGWYIDDASLVTGPYILNSPEGFESGFGDWSVDEGSWDLGTPTGGPDKAHNGENCIGTNIDGNYQQASESRLISPPFIVPSVSENPRFRFWYWFSYSTNDWGEVQIKTDTGEWETISNQMNNQGGDAWSYGSIDISKYAGSTVQLAFLFHSADDGSSYSNDVSSGWYIDDASLVTGPYILNSPEGFESGFGDWSVDEGSWDLGTPTGGPDKAHNGDNCIGTNIDGNYQQASESRLISPPFIVPSASENPRFRFWYWFSYSTNDWGEVQIKTSTGEWETISNQMNNMGGDAWSYGLVDISKYANSKIQIAFLFHSADDGSSYSNDVSSGWYIDDISLIKGPYIFNNPESFESGFGDWSVDEGSWEVGLPASGPGTAHGGQNCAGTNLIGNYQQASDSKLITPPFTVPGTSDNPAIRFWHWFSFSTNDWGAIQITTDDGITWNTISNQFINTSSGAWSPYYISLSPYANSKVRLAFYFHSADDGSSYSNDVSSGWYIDDINFDNIIWVKENEIQKINIYPNPFSEKATIQFDDTDLSGYRLSVYNISGTKVLEMKDIRSDKIELEKGSLPAGIYIIELKGAKTYRNKIIIR